MNNVLNQVLEVCEKGVLLAKQIELKLTSSNFSSSQYLQDVKDIQALAKSAGISFAYAGSALLENNNIEAVDLITNATEILIMIRRSLPHIRITIDNINKTLNDILNITNKLVDLPNSEDEDDCDCCVCSGELPFQLESDLKSGKVKFIPLTLNDGELQSIKIPGNKGLMDIVKDIIKKSKEEDKDERG